VRKQIVTILTLLLLLLPRDEVVARASGLSLKASPRMGFSPASLYVEVRLVGDEEVLVVSLFDPDGVLTRSSLQELSGEHLVSFTWFRPGVGDLTLRAETMIDGRVTASKSLDLHYF
jgi:hypothetical protein